MIHVAAADQEFEVNVTLVEFASAFGNNVMLIRLLFAIQILQKGAGTEYVAAPSRIAPSCLRSVSKSLRPA
jgi:hypothetical protein